MRPCKKYKQASHHMNPTGDCRSCAYFSRFNCGTHPDGNPSSAMMSLNQFAFDS